MRKKGIWLARVLQDRSGGIIIENPGRIKFDELVKSRNSIEFVIPAKAGIQLFQDVLDPGFRRGDDPNDFLRDHQICRGGF
jgi:hypothetical protein